MAPGHFVPVLLTLVPLSLVTAGDNIDSSALLWLSEAELARRFGRPVEPTHTSTYQNKIEHFVVLFLENRPADHFFGCMDLPGFEGVDRAEGVQPTCGTAKYVCEGAPGFSFFSPFFEAGANSSEYPYGPQSPQHAASGGARGDAIQMFSAEQLPVKAALAREYGVFNKLFASVPAASMP